jgi:hypothetical protein
VSVETGLDGAVAALVEVVSVVVVLGDIVSLVVDELVGEVVFAVEPGVALVPELLYDVDVVLGSFLQPARPPVARTIAATYGIKRFMMSPVQVLVRGPTTMRQRPRMGIHVDD